MNDYAYRFIVCGVRVDTRPIGESSSVSSDSVSGNRSDDTETDPGSSTPSENKSASGNKARIVDIDP